MSRIGKVPIPIPDGVQVTIGDEGEVLIKGPKGDLRVATRNNVLVRRDDGRILVERHTDNQQDRAYHGLYHRLITNAIVGVTQGYTRELEMVGVGYRANVQGNRVMLSVGRSHELTIVAPEGVTIDSSKPTQIRVSGTDKQLVHQLAAQIRASCPPEPYKGKGIRFAGEQVRRKVGKSGVK